MVKERGWQVQLPGLLSQARSQVIDTENTPEGERPDTFTELKFHQKLINFIIANDQVFFVMFLYLILLMLTFSTFKSLNLMDCSEFRELLLLLRCTLTDGAIPHRTKLRELVIQAWKEYFEVLKRDLAVGSSSLVLSSVMFSSFLGRDGGNLLYHGHVVRPKQTTLSRNHSALDCETRGHRCFDA